MNESQRVEFEAFMEARFGDCIDRRRCKNGDGNDYMSFDMGMARIVWQHMQQKLDAVVAENASLKQIFATREFSTKVTDAFSDTAVLKIDGDEHHSWQWVDNDSAVIRAVLEVMKPLTPATDAILNSVRAEGVEMYCAEVLQNNMRIAAEAGKSNAYRIFSHLTAEAMEFAAQLRNAPPKGDSDEA